MSDEVATMDRLEQVRDIFEKLADDSPGYNIRGHETLIKVAIGRTLDALDEGWSDEVPTVPGDYYVQGFEYNNKPTLCRLYLDEDNELWCKDVGYDLPYTVRDLSNCQWSGPITPPKPEGE